MEMELQFATYNGAENILNRHELFMINTVSQPAEFNWLHYTLVKWDVHDLFK